MSIEVISTVQLLSRPRYANGLLLDNNRNWTRPDIVALKALCDRKAGLEKSSTSLGRKATAIARFAVDTGLNIPYEWRDAIYTYKKKEPTIRALQKPLMAYPYIENVRGEHEDLLAVNALLRKGVPEQIRADICQEIMLDILLGDTSIEELQGDPKKVQSYFSRIRKMNHEGGGYAMSLDVPMKDGRSWYDVLPEPEKETVSSFEELADAFPRMKSEKGGGTEKQKARDYHSRMRIEEEAARAPYLGIEKPHDNDAYRKYPSTYGSFHR